MVKWNLGDILKEENYSNLLAETEGELAHFEKYLDILAPQLSTAKFKEIIDAFEHLAENMQRLYGYPNLQEAVDQKLETPKFLKSKAKNLLIKFDDQTRTIWHWFKGKEVAGKQRLDDMNAKRLFDSTPELAYVLQRTRDLARYTLSEKEEAIITKKDLTGTEALKELRDLIETDQEYLFKSNPKSKGRVIKTAAELLQYVHSAKANEREAAYRALFLPYKINQQKYFAIYENVVKDWSNEAKLRGYDTSISMRNNANDVSDEAVKTLLQVCREQRFLFQDFFKYKAKVLGVKKLSRFDVYAPIKGTKDRKLSYEEGVNIVLECFTKFNLGFAAKASQIIDQQHIDSHPNPRKTSGAFCATISPNITPYVMLNYSNKERDVEVLAHELGHGIHSLYASGQPVSAQDAPLPLAETASTFGEMLVFERLYGQAKSVAEKRALLLDKISASYATIIRQNYFVLFELEAHRLLPQGITLSDFNNLYFENLKEQFGDSVKIDPIFKYEWTYIPHIVNTPFYCYAYSFGELLSLALYELYKEQGQEFIPKLEKILAAGGSQNPQKLLKQVGIDITEKKFWEKSFELVARWVAELKAL